MIEFQDVRFTYDGQRYALNGVTTRIRPGEFVCVLGGNGSGKSTLAKHINALLVPDEGRVQVGQWDTADENLRYLIRSTAGMVFQNPDDQIVATLVENDVAFGPENLGVPADELRIRVEEALKTVGLSGFERNETNALSGGQKQRVAIAGVLAMKPQVLIFDEASAMIDPRGRTGLLRVIRQLNSQGLTIIMITHFMDEAALADRVLVMDDGRIVAEGTPGEVLTRAQELRRLHLDTPFPVTFSLACQDAGLPITTTLDTDALEEELCNLLLTR